MVIHDDILSYACIYRFAMYSSTSKARRRSRRWRWRRPLTPPKDHEAFHVLLMHGKRACSRSKKERGYSNGTCTVIQLFRIDRVLVPGPQLWRTGQCTAQWETLSSTWRQSLASIWPRFHVVQIRHLQEEHHQCTHVDVCIREPTNLR